MVIAFANNQSMTTIMGTSSIIETDPVEMGSNDRASAVLNAHYLFTQGGTATLTWQGQTSNDGVKWTDIIGFTGFATAPTTSPEIKVEGVNGAWLRFQYTFAIAGGAGGEIAGTCFDLHVRLDHA